MVERIKNFLFNKSIEEELNRLQEINADLQESELELDRLTKSFSQQNNIYINRFNQCDSEKGVEVIEKNFNDFKVTHNETLRELTKSRNKLEKEKAKILKKSKVKNVVDKLNKEKADFDFLKENTKKGIIEYDKFAKIIKSNSEKVKYADTIVFRNGKMLILKRFPWVFAEKDLWTIPGGHVEPNEDFETAARRELSEETNLCADNMELLGIYENDDIIIHYFKTCIEDNNDLVVSDAMETMGHKWIDLDEIHDYSMLFNMKRNIKKFLNIPNRAFDVNIIKEGIVKGWFSPEQTINICSVLKDNENLDKSKKEEKVSKVINEFKEGKLKTAQGEKVKDKKQAVAIALSEADKNKNELKKAEETTKQENNLKEKEHLTKMIAEHERLIEVLKPHAEMDSKVKDELVIQYKELQEYKDKLKEIDSKKLDKAQNKTDFSEKEREELAKEGEAMKDGSFPIRNKQDLLDAIKSIGRAKDYEKAKKWIEKRAKELKLEDLLPEKWIEKSLDGIFDEYELGEALEKSRALALQKKHPNSEWKTINGAKVLIGSNGKVVAGAGGKLNESEKETTKENKTSDEGKTESKYDKDAAYNALNHAEESNPKLFNKLKKEGAFMTEEGFVSTMKKHFPKEFNKQKNKLEKEEKKETERIESGKLTSTGQYYYDNSMEQYKKASNTEKEKLRSLVKENLKKMEESKEYGYKGDKDKEEASRKFLKDTSKKNIEKSIQETFEKAIYEGREVELEKPMKGDVKKYKVYVKNDKGNVIKVDFGDPDMEIKRDNPERRENFRARHKCDEKKDKTTAGYWSCKFWDEKPVNEILNQ